MLLIIISLYNTGFNEVWSTVNVAKYVKKLTKTFI